MSEFLYIFFIFYVCSSTYALAVTALFLVVPLAAVHSWPCAADCPGVVEAMLLGAVCGRGPFFGLNSDEVEPL